ncbi:hypothetical protein BHM03_00030943 [Ensete ventricosum]|nr:hypothetical protein BHM03_00030943 [Ensete ventricosum]
MRLPLRSTDLASAWAVGSVVDAADLYAHSMLLQADPAKKALASIRGSDEHPTWMARILRPSIDLTKVVALRSEGLSYPKAIASARKEVDLEEHHSVAEADLLITKEGTQMQGNG